MKRNVAGFDRKLTDEFALSCGFSAASVKCFNQHFETETIIIFIYDNVIVM